MAQELIRDNLEDLGLDAFHVYEDKSPPPLFPPIEAPLPTIPTEEEIWSVYKMRELNARLGHRFCLLLQSRQLTTPNRFAG